MTLIKYPCFLLYMVAAGTAAAAANDSPPVWYQWQTESFVAQCPTDDLPPFRLDDPSISQRTKGVILTYSTQIPDKQWVQYDVFAEDCETRIPTSDSPNSAEDDSVPIDSTLTIGYSDYVTSSATTRLNLEVNPAGLKDYGALFYTEKARTGVPPAITTEGDARLCVRMALWNGVPNTPNAVEITWLDTVVLFGVKLEVENESALDFVTAQGKSGEGRNLLRTNFSPIPVEAKDDNSQSIINDRPNRHLCESTWGVDVFTCPPDVTIDNPSVVVNLPAEPNNEAIPKNLPVRLCIQPNAVTRSAGVTLKDVQGLYYTSSTSNDGIIQTAVEEFNDSLDGRTTKSCGEELCIVETTMDETFHGTTVLASGKMIFQPSQETVFNQIVVDFELPIEISDEAFVIQGDSGGSTTLMFTVSFLIGLLASSIGLIL